MRTLYRHIFETLPLDFLSSQGHHNRPRDSHGAARSAITKQGRVRASYKKVDEFHCAFLARRDHLRTGRGSSVPLSTRRRLVALYSAPCSSHPAMNVRFTSHRSSRWLRPHYPVVDSDRSVSERQTPDRRVPVLSRRMPCY